MRSGTLISVVVCLVLCCCGAGPRGTVQVRCSGSTPPIEFAAAEARSALKAAGYSLVDQGADMSITLGVAEGEPQSYSIRVTKQDGRRSIQVSGGDEIGAMYAGLDLAEQVRLHHSVDSIAECDAKPYIARRGIKFNFPLDARTPSYDDTGDSAQNNIETTWDLEFWRAYLDAMARNRYNVLTLWNPHPFPSMVRLEKYPDCALDDVCVTTLKPTWEHGKWADPQGVTPAILSNLRVVKRMTIDQKIEFWRKVMRHARDRGIDVYIVTWNVLVNSAAGKYGITDKQDNPATVDYMRSCVRELILMYPDLAGIGITAGENMTNGSGDFARERWLWRTYGMGILDAKRLQPGRKVAFIHRHWNTQVSDIVREWSGYPDPFNLEFKYSRARLYSSPAPPFANSLLKEMQPHGLKCWWNLRNDDIFVFRWGDPDYVREFVRNFPLNATAGYVVGSDGYVWGREFISTEPENPRQLEIDKHWFSFMLWGRMGYDPTLSREILLRTLGMRFPELKDNAVPLLHAWQSASQIIPLVNRFHWRDWDFMWSVEGCIDQREGFHTVRHFINTPTMEGSGLMTIPQFIATRLKNQSMTMRQQRTTPVGVAEQLKWHAATARSCADAIRRRALQPSKELRLTLGDIEAMAHLGDYYAEKILGATELHAFERSGGERVRDSAILHLERAIQHWQDYARAATRQYRPQLLARTRELDWSRILEDVKKDLEIARSAVPSQPASR